MFDEREHPESKFYWAGELFDAEPLQWPTHFANTARTLTLLTNEEVNNFLRNRATTSKTSFFRIKLLNKQTDSSGEASFSRTHQEIIVGQKQENNVKKTKYDKRMFLQFSSSFQSFWEKLGKPEESQTYLIYSRIKIAIQFLNQCCSKTQNRVRTQVQYRTIHPDNITRLNYFQYTAKSSKSTNLGTVLGSQHRWD